MSPSDHDRVFITGTDDDQEGVNVNYSKHHALRQSDFTAAVARLGFGEKPEGCGDPSCHGHSRLAGVALLCGCPVETGVRIAYAIDNGTLVGACVRCGEMALNVAVAP